LNSQEKAEFEKTFGPLSDYQVNVVTQQRPFPFRPWFAAAVGLPIGAVLLFGFFVKAYEALFFKNEGDFTSGGESPSTAFSADRLDRLLHRVGRLNIFAIGGFVLIFALGLWALPHLLSEFGRHGVALVIRYKWVALAIAAVFLAFVAWIVFLRYLLARKAIETQAEVEKYRLQLELMGSHQKPAQLAGTQQTKLALPQKPLAQSAQSDKDHRTPS
jgi:MFS family permease